MPNTPSLLKEVPATVFRRQLSTLVKEVAEQQGRVVVTIDHRPRVVVSSWDEYQALTYAASQ